MVVGKQYTDGHLWLLELRSRAEPSQVDPTCECLSVVRSDTGERQWHLRRQ
jgi:hypothetical protein